MDLNKIKLYDSHLHFKSDEELKLFLKSNIKGVVSINKKQEINDYFNIKDENLFFSVGVHPWYADKVTISELEKAMDKANFIGEIGLDNIWCDIDIEKQKQVFIKQLEHAHKANKAVILHTKGMEEEIYNIIKKYKLRYLVHWYSSMKSAKDFINLDCYFTIGPSVMWDRAVINLVKELPINRILIETDGIDAINWAYQSVDRDIKIGYREALINSINEISKIKKIEVCELVNIVENNFQTFFKI